MPPYLQEYFRLYRDWWVPESIPVERKRIALAAYYALIEQTDRLVGRLLQSLADNGLADNTLVVYCTDHGEMAGTRGAWDKVLFYEDSVRVPMIARLPGRIAPGSVSPLACNLRDLADTFCEVAGAERIVGTEVRSLWPLMTGTAQNWDDCTDSEILHTAPVLGQKTPATARMLRWGDWKMWVYEIDEQFHFSLFDLKHDPQERQDRIGDPAVAEVETRLKIRLLAGWDWRRIRDIGQRGRSDRDWINRRLHGVPTRPHYPYPDGLDDDVVIDVGAIRTAMGAR